MGFRREGLGFLGSAVGVSLLGLRFSVFRIRISGLRVYDLSLFRLFSCQLFVVSRSRSPGFLSFMFQVVFLVFDFFCVFWV